MRASPYLKIAALSIISQGNMPKPKIILACENLILCYDLMHSFKEFDVVRVKTLEDLYQSLNKKEVDFVFISITKNKLSEAIFNCDKLIISVNEHKAKKIGFSTYADNEFESNSNVNIKFDKIYTLPFSIDEVNKYLMSQEIRLDSLPT